MTLELAFHICRRAEWEAAERIGRYLGSSQDAADGFIHFSTAAQIVASAARHRTGRDGLLLIEADARTRGAALRWDKSCRGELFPHLHGPLPFTAVRRVAALPLGPDLRHMFPWGLGG